MRWSPALVHTRVVTSKVGLFVGGSTHTSRIVRSPAQRPFSTPAGSCTFVRISTAYAITSAPSMLSRFIEHTRHVRTLQSMSAAADAASERALRAPRTHASTSAFMGSEDVAAGGLHHEQAKPDEVQAARVSDVSRMGCMRQCCQQALQARMHTRRSVSVSL